MIKKKELKKKKLSKKAEENFHKILEEAKVGSEKILMTWDSNERKAFWMLGFIGIIFGYIISKDNFFVVLEQEIYWIYKIMGRLTEY